MKKYSYQNNELFLELENINKQLWDIEDKIRIKESSQSFDFEFIESRGIVSKSKCFMFVFSRRIFLIYFDSIFFEKSS